MSRQRHDNLELAHRTPECTGDWRQEQSRHWRCSECHMLYYHAPEVADTLRRENTMGRVLKVLARMGQQTRDRGEELPEGWDR
jgi:hypothetical protein